LRADVVKPVQNLAINAATTHDALFTTPENSTDAANKRLVARVLQPGMTQVSSMVAQNPKVVSVELGGNEVLNTRIGIVASHLTFTPYDEFRADYDAVLDQVQNVAKEALLVGLIHDVARFPAFRTGNEMALARPYFAALGVTVAGDCDGSNNLLFVPVVVLVAAQAHALSCADKGPGVPDFILTPEDAQFINSLLATMNAHIKSEAARRGFAFFELEELYGRADIKGPFNPLILLGVVPNAPPPYGPLISLDGVHPTAAGARILAEAAARAFDLQYNHHILADDASALIANP
jgi:lysophospholipase L1-like esterase